MKQSKNSQTVGPRKSVRILLLNCVLCTWTVGTSVKALMKSSSSTAPALSLDTVKTEQNQLMYVRVCAFIKSRTRIPVLAVLT